MTTKPIMVGYEGSETSIAALDWALAAALLHKTSVVVVHAEPPILDLVPPIAGYAATDSDALLRAGAAILDQALVHAAATSPDVEITTKMVTTSIARELVETSGEAEMIVVGSRGLGGLSALLVGSTGLALAAHAACPVVVMRPRETNRKSGDGTEAGRVVVGVDGSGLATAAVAFAFEEAAMRGLEITALHAWRAPFFDLPVRGAPTPDAAVINEFEAEQVLFLEQTLELWMSKYPAVKVRSKVVHADPLTALVAASAGAEMLVLGSRGRGGFRSLLLGSVSHGALHHAHCPVAVIRPDAS